MLPAPDSRFSGSGIGPGVALAGGLQHAQELEAGVAELPAHGRGIGCVRVAALHLGADEALSLAVRPDRVVRGARDAIRRLTEQSKPLGLA
jgi:hypothetical protein